ncbi:MAG: hypothetical protein HGJ93_17015 [Desulfosarcina sp.]|nr:hypothetical protein [Desulfosarcina sp.]MBC2767586.1 hypothetical protein [Desulfosarcina sp.]
MDDFLHNLRSGKLKQPDRGRRDYTDYKGPQRRTPNERRRPDYYAKVTSENFTLVKGSLDILAENQKRMADTLAAGEKTATRIADALETIASMMKSHLGGEDVLPQRSQPADAQPDGNAIDSIVPAETVDNPTGIGGIGNVKLSDEDKPGLLDIIAAMRTAGNSWEKVARHIDDQNIPTISGKGKWRGPVVKKFWDANTEDAGS